MTRRYDRSRLQRDERINWSLEELKELVNNKNSQVRVERTKRHIALYPYHLCDLKKSLHEILGAEINRYNKELKGLLLAYKNPKLLSTIGAILHDTPFIHVDVDADFYIFKPEIDSVLKGIINKKGNNHIGVLVYKVFNVSIPRGDEEEDTWLGNHYNVGDEVKFTIKKMDFKGRLPFIRGTLISSDEADNDEGSILKSSSKKSKKHKFTDEEFDLSDGILKEDLADDTTNESECSPKKSSFFSSINNSNSSESEGELEKLKKPDKTKSVKSSSSLTSNKGQRAINGRKKMIAAVKTVNSSEASDSEPEAPKKGLSKKSSKYSAASLHENLEDNEYSVSGKATLDSITTESPKKSKSSLSLKKKLKEEPPEELTRRELEELPLPRKRKHLESQNPDNSDDSKKMKKSKKPKKSSISEEPEQDPRIKKKSKREKERKSLNNHAGSEEDETESPQQEENEKAVEKLGEEDSDDGMSHFMFLKKTKDSKDRSYSKTVRKGREEVNNSLTEAPRKESAKKSSKHSVASPDKNPEDNKHLIFENSDNLDDSKKMKKSKKSKITIREEAEDLNNDSVSEADSSEREKDDEPAKELDEDDSEDDISHFLALRKIKIEKEENWAKTAQEEQEFVNNSMNDTAYHEESISPTKKSKKKKHRVDDDAIVSTNVEVISERLKEQQIIKKSKKLRKQESLPEEEANAVVNNIKKEKEDSMIVKSPRMINLQIEESDSDCETRLNNEKDTSKRKKSKETTEINGSPDDDGVPNIKEIKSQKKKAKRKKSGNIEEHEVENDVETNSHNFPSPTKVGRVEKTKTAKASRSQDDSGELSDASLSRSRILMKKEESVFFGNIKIKQESHHSDVEILGPKRRQREQGVNSDERNAIDDVSIKEESVNVKSEECGRTNKIKIENSHDNSIVKSEPGVKSKGKIKTTFSE